MSSITRDLEAAIHHHQNGRLCDAESLYRAILSSDRTQIDAIHLLGVIASQHGHYWVAIEYIRQAIQLGGDSVTTYCNLANAYHALGMYTDVIVCYRRAIELAPTDPELYVNLGIALRTEGHHSEAIESYSKAITLDPNCVEAHNNIAIELSDEQQCDRAIVHFERALNLAPDHFEILNNLGNALKAQGQLDEAMACYRRSIKRNPKFADAHNNLGHVEKDRGNLGAAVECFRTAISINPNFSVAHSNLVFTRMYSHTTDQREQQDELRRWNERHAGSLVKLIKPFLNDRSVDRRLRIGYVSPDFRDHCQSLFTTPLFSSHNHESFEIFCFSNTTHPDDMTTRLQGLADQWRDITRLNDDQVAKQVRDDRIDILVDLSMHMARNRLLVFARKPAPVQVSWLAYPGSSGLSTIDYRFTDIYLDPPGLDDQDDCEESIRLPDSFWCYDPLDEKSVVNALPAVQAGRITFGCFNNFCKVNPWIVKIWSQVLKSVDRSRLILLTFEGTHRLRVLEQFESEGITRDRVEFVSIRPRSEYLKFYQQIDISLDTVPYNGHTTSLDSFWMGVPVVTLVGQMVVGRAGLSQLTNLGLPELIATTPEEYVETATDLARNLPRLITLRTNLRDQLKASPLMDASRFARNIESAYRQIWQRWCSK